jgi:hypothetical protein
VLRTARRFPLFYSALEINLVEISTKLVNAQRETLKCGPLVVAPVVAAAPNESTSGDVVTAVLPDGKQVFWHWYPYCSFDLLTGVISFLATCVCNLKAVFGCVFKTSADATVSRWTSSSVGACT